MTNIEIVKAIVAVGALLSAILVMIWVVLLQICFAIQRLKDKP
jgi:hypothetical protein